MRCRGLPFLVIDMISFTPFFVGETCQSTYHLSSKASNFFLLRGRIYFLNGKLVKVMLPPPHLAATRDKSTRLPALSSFPSPSRLLVALYGSMRLGNSPLKVDAVIALKCGQFRG